MPSICALLSIAMTGFCAPSIETCGGEVFKSVGDALHAVFPTATAAVEAAVDGLRSLSTEDWDGEPIEVRMAVYTGEAEAVNGDWLGRPLNRCARLLAASNGGQILVSHTTARLAEADLAAGVHLVGLGAYRFRGLDRAEDVFQVVAPGLASVFGPLTGCEPPDPSSVTDSTSSAPAAPALPSSLAGHVAQMWVGRDDELEILRSAWRDASSGGFRTVLVAGEPGAGKTALAARFAADAAQDGAWVLHGHCEEDALIPYRAFAEALDQLVASAGGSLLAEHTTDHGGDLCSVVPLLTRRVPGLRPTSSTTPEADRSRLTTAVVGLLESGCASAADRHRARRLALGRRGNRGPPARVGTPRAERSVGDRGDVSQHRRGPLPAVGAVARRPATSSRCHSSRCSAASRMPTCPTCCTELPRRPLGDDGEAFALSLRRDTGGNPFFIVEVLRHLIETGAIAPGDGRWSLDAAAVSIPEGIREVVGRRLDRLGADASETLRTAAVIGPLFDLQVLAQVMGMTEDAVLATLESASASDLVAEVADAVDRWKFTHELVRRTLLDQLSLSRSTRVHRSVGEVLERLRPRESAALAYHFAAAAGLGDAGRAVHYAFAAADQAAGNAAHGDAARLLERGMDAAEAAGELDEIGHVEMLTRIGSEWAKAGEAGTAYTRLDRAIELARRLGSAELLAEAILARTSYSWSMEPDSDPRILTAEALAAEPLSPNTRARLLAARAGFGSYGSEPLSQKRAEAAEAVAAARGTGDPESLGAALVASANLGSGPDDVADREFLLDELMAAARAANRPAWEATAWGFRIDRHLILGHYDQARAAEIEQEQMTTASRDPYAELICGEMTSRRACIDGNFAEAERLAAEQVPLGERLGAGPDAMLVTAAALCVPIWNLQGRLDELEPLLMAMPKDGEWVQMHDLWAASLYAATGTPGRRGRGSRSCVAADRARTQLGRWRRRRDHGDRGFAGSGTRGCVDRTPPALPRPRLHFRFHAVPRCGRAPHRSTSHDVRTVRRSRRPFDRGR